MFRVTITARDARTSFKTTNPKASVERILDSWKSRGFWIDVPLPGFGETYIGFKNGKQVAKLTVEEVKDEQ